MKFMREVGDGEVSIVDGKLMPDVSDDEVDAARSWVQEFAEGQKQADVAHGIFKEDDLWSNLQKEWEKSAADNGEMNNWFEEFSSYYDPFKVHTLLILKGLQL